METLRQFVRSLLQPAADFFSGFDLPEPITHWGHPLMMAIVIFVMGTFTGWVGWRIRLSDDPAVANENRSAHRKLAPWLFLFLAAGYSGGVLSLIMQGQEIFASPHFWTGSVVIALLASNGLISATKFGGNQAALRTTHAYLGTIALAIMVIHAIFGVTLGLAF